jgi:hypothetical protein
MKHFLKILWVLILGNTALMANPNNGFKEGYIISLKGDTTKGFLLSQESRDAADKCIFKANTDSESQIYKPGEISGYRYLNGKYYVSKEINIDSITKKVVFLELLIKGMANVYYYVDDLEHYYIEKSANGLIELTEKPKNYSHEGRTYIVTPKYKGKLLYALQDCPAISNQIQNTILTHNSLIKLTKDYHEKVCNSESCIIYERDNTKAKLQWGLLVGFSKNQYNFGNQIITNYGKSSQIGIALKLSNVFMFNSHFNIKANVIVEKDISPYTLSLSDGIKVGDIMYYDEYYRIIDKRYFTNQYHYLTEMEVDIDVVDLKIPITLNYDFVICPKTNLTCGAGISNKFILSQNKKLEVGEFYEVYGKSINSLLTGLIATACVEGKWLGKNAVFVNVSYEYLIDFRSKVDNTLKLLNNQVSLQAGIYF